jgi:SAM-dependent methyltransferase
MSFDVQASAYDRFMGRYSEPLAGVFMAFAGPEDGMRVLDVGCGPGALTVLLAARLGPAAVSAVDPSSTFVSAARSRCPGVNVREAAAESLPFEGHSFDASLAQLVVHFMDDPVAGLGEMARVTRAGGIVAACVWDLDDEGGPLGAFWRAARDLDAGLEGESALAGTRDGHLALLMEEAGLRDVESSAISVTVEHGTFRDWWEPFTLGVGPAGSYVAGLDSTRRERLRRHCEATMPPEPFALSARAWAARGVA